MISRRNKTDLSHGNQLSIQLIWPEPKLTTKPERRSDAEKWPDLLQQIISQVQSSPGVGQTADPQCERLWRTSPDTSVLKRDTQSSD